MAQPSELERLLEQRRLLVARSGELRVQMAQDFARLHRAAGWIERAYALARKGRAFWPILAGLAGLLLVRTGGGWLGRAGKLLSWWRLVRKISTLWQSFQAQWGFSRS